MKTASEDPPCVTLVAQRCGTWMRRRVTEVAERKFILKTSAVTASG
jgi:hypothetical protein